MRKLPTMKAARIGTGTGKRHGNPAAALPNALTLPIIITVRSRAKRCLAAVSGLFLAASPAWARPLGFANRREGS
jgi:hypothetical protein